jgi:hypothetical protein
LADATAAAAAVGAVAAGVAVAFRLILRKSTWLPCAVDSSWYTSDGTSSSTGTALPSRATVA